MAVQVWLGDQSAGELAPLRYAPEWLAQWRAFPLSPRLPLNGGAPPSHLKTSRLDAGPRDAEPRGADARDRLAEEASDELATYLRLLLPQGLAQDGLRRALRSSAEAAEASEAGLPSTQGMSTEEIVAMLSSAGDDLPGALSLRDTREKAHARSHGMPLRALSVEAMSERFQGPPEERLLLEPGAAQPVLPWWPASSGEPLIGVYLDQERWWWTSTPQLASTHLLEASATGDAGERLLLNKLFCLRLAARLGLDVAPVELLRLPMPVLQFQRWDRQRLEDGRVRRLHAVSVAQVLGAAGMPSAGSGPAAMPIDVPLWMQLGALLEHSPQPLVDRRALIRWWIFQGLTGQFAASPMDLWCHLDATGLRLAPVMNLWCAAAEPAAELAAEHVADHVAGSAEALYAMVPMCLQASDWALVARACGASPRSLAHELRRMGEAAPLEARALARQLKGTVPEDLMQAVVDAITAAAAVQLDCVDDLLHTDHRE